MSRNVIKRGRSREKVTGERGEIRGVRGDKKKGGKRGRGKYKGKRREGEKEGNIGRKGKEDILDNLTIEGVFDIFEVIEGFID